MDDLLRWKRDTFARTRVVRRSPEQVVLSLSRL